MTRSKYDAWSWVVVAFVVETFVVNAFLYVGGNRLWHSIQGTPWYGPSMPDALMWTLVAVSLGLSTTVFWNRWRCIEAFTSRFCTGLANFSLFTALPAALLYANYRGVLKLMRR